MRSVTARDAKNAFGQLIDLARQQPVTVQKHGRPFVVVMSIEEFKRLKKRNLHPEPNARLGRATRPR
jgi:prevent-host-death family protein